MTARAPGRPTPVRTLEASPCEATPACGAADVFRLLGRAHVLDILHVLAVDADRPVGFLEIQERLRVSPTTLSTRLKDIVDAGLATREEVAAVPPRVLYRATAKARVLQPLLADVDAWAALAAEGEAAFEAWLPEGGEAVG